jgi:glutathione peroxidase
MSVFAVKIKGLTQGDDALAAVDGKVVLVVNVASKCGLTPQYTGLEALHKEFSDKGFSVVGVPCNQFGAQEPGSAQEITTFCSTTYGVTFPMTEKIDVNGDGRHPLYQQLTPVQDAEGHSGDIRWNFEKFLIGKNGEVLARFSPMIAPNDEKLRSAIRAALA